MRAGDLVIFAALPLVILICCMIAAIHGDYGFSCTLALMGVLAMVCVIGLDVRRMR